MLISRQPVPGNWMTFLGLSAQKKAVNIGLNDENRIYLTRRHTLCHTSVLNVQSFKSVKSLNAHMSVHSGSTQHKIKCELFGCQRLFRTKSQMKTHLKSHKDRKYTCDWPGL